MKPKVLNRITKIKLSYVTFQVESEIWSHKTCGPLIQVYLIWNALWREIKMKIRQCKLLL